MDEKSTVAVSPPQDPAGENGKKIRHALEVWHESGGRDARPFLELMAQEVDFWSVATGGPASGLGFTGVRTRYNEIADYFQHINDGWRMDFYLIQSLIASGDDVMVMSECQYTARVSGKPCRTLAFTYFGFGDGKIVKYREMFDSAGALAALAPG